MKLINADKFIKRYCEENCEKRRCRDNSDKCQVILELEIEPIAYDVDKVVEQLEKAKDEIANEDYCRGINDKGKCYGRNCFKCCAEYLIEIVKAGGING